MLENGVPPSPEGSPLPEKKLVSWKEIAAHLGREVRTVQRWEKTEGLPVKRHEHQKKSTVYAFPSDLDEWVRKRQPVDDPEADAAFAREHELSGTDSPIDSVDPPDVLLTLVDPGRIDPAPDLVNPSPPVWRRVVIAVSALAIFSAASFAIYRWTQPKNLAYEKVRIVVLPFNYTSGDSKPDYITVGLADVIRTKLGQLHPPHLGVIAPHTTSRDNFPTAARRPTRAITIFFGRPSPYAPRCGGPPAAPPRAPAILGQAPNDGIPPREAKPKAREFAQRALQLNPRLAEAHAVLGNMAMSYDWDLPTAERELRRAIELNANDPTAHEWYCHLLIVEGRNAEALTEARQALDLDPVAPLFHTVLAETYYYGRSYDAAMEEARQVVKLHPGDLSAQFWLGSAYREKRMYPQAVEIFQRARHLSGDNPAMLMAYGHTQALAGNVQEARATLQKLQQLAGTRFVPNLYPAAIHVGLGEADEAFRLLDLAYQERIDRLVYLNVDPMADPIRSDPRFAQLMAKI